MPNPSFEPVIGSSFDALAGQRANWAGFNANIEAANMARQAQAEQAHNQWLAQVAQMQNQQQQQADQQAQYASSLAAAQAQRAQEAALSESQFGRNMAYENRRIDAENARTTAQERAANVAAGAHEQVRQEALNNTGQNFASSYALASRSLAEAKDALDNVNGQKELADDRLAELTAKPLKTLTPDELNEKTTLSNTKHQRELAKVVKQAESSYNDLKAKHDRLVESHLSKGFEVDDQTGTVFHPETNRRWSFKPKTAVALTGETAAGYQPPAWLTNPTATPENAVAAAATDYFGRANMPGVSADVTGLFAPQAAPTQTATSPWAGMAPQVAQAPVAAPAAPNIPLSATIPTVTTQAAFDALPPNTVYIGQDGRKYRKP